MHGKLIGIPDKIIKYSFYLLFFLVPLFLMPFNYELFEYNKMMLTYALTVIIVGSWLIKMILYKKLIFSRTPLDIPLLLFLASQIISTIFSIDRHVSIFGYYSRFNGGLLSTISYILLYYAFISNFPKEKIKKLLTVILASGVIVSVYGILEHFGIDKNIWVQDVQNRVFSTLGQPNWLAAYIAVLLSISIGLSLSSFQTQNVDLGAKSQKSKVKSQNYKSKFKNIGLLVFISSVFYLTLVFTKSRSGFIGFWIGNAVLWSILLGKYKKAILKTFLIFNFSFLIFNFIFGTPFTEFNRFTFPELLLSDQRPTTNDQRPIGSSIIDIGITESGVIRNIVWKGAIDIAKNYPLFGTGVETFAFAYYKFRPVEHNMTSEWDFLYNKAHNEYLNYAATTGFVGLGSYLLVILTFIVWCVKQISKSEFLISNQIPNPKSQKSGINNYLGQLEIRSIRNFIQMGLFAAWLSILITNFFGFSVVIIQIFFYLIPAISFTLARPPLANGVIKPKTQSALNNYQLIISALFLFFIFYLLYLISRLWYADLYFAAGHNASQSQEYTSAYQNFRQAIILNDNEPFYYNEFSLPSAQIAAALFDEKEGTVSAQLTREAIMASDTAVTSSPNNVNFWKTRTRVYYSLSQIDEKYLTESLSALENARILSPTDPKIVYNLAVIYDKVGKREEAMKLLSETTKLKADYRDAYFAMGLFYERDKMKDKAKSQYEFILNRINPNDEETKKKMEELR